ncbi:MAG: SprB repeat-containing protein [Saprospiraceae bacterium]|nr:SprB repeat-containing protein [Candidatus Opimibacter skivensis]
MDAPHEQCFSVQQGNCQLVVTSILSDVLCAGDTTGSISLNVENATAPVSYTVVKWRYNVYDTKPSSRRLFGNYNRWCRLYSHPGIYNQ